MEIKFRLTLEPHGAVRHAHSTLLRWVGPGCIVFSFAQRGKAISAHFSSDKKGLRHIKTAIDDFCGWCFDVFDWCTMVVAMIDKPSVERLVLKCGFEYLIHVEQTNIYARSR